MSVGGVFLLLATAIAVHYLSKRLIPIFVPRGRLKPIAVGWLGGVVASLVEAWMGPWEPRLLGIYLGAGVMGAAAAILGWGLAPFLAILLGLKRKDGNRAMVRPKGEKR